MIGVVKRPPPFEKLVSCKTLLKRSRQRPFEAVWVGGTAGSDQILPWQPWIWAGRSRHGGGGYQDCR